MIAGVLLFNQDITALLGARGESANLQSLVGDYLIGLAFSFPATILLFEFNSLMRLDGDSTRVIVAVLTMTVLDIAGDLLNALVIAGMILGEQDRASAEIRVRMKRRASACRCS